MNAIPNIKEAKSYENQSHALRRRPPKRIGFFPIPECTRLSIRQAVDRLLEKAHELADRADAKRDMYLRRALLRQLLIGMSTKRYLPASGTAGLARSLVKGNSRVLAPPPMMMARLSSVGVFRFITCYGGRAS